MRVSICGLAVAGLLILAAPPSEAQVTDMLVPAGAGGAIEVERPFFDGFFDEVSSFKFRGTFFT